MSKVSVSVIIPIYNAERHLAECLDSCLGQTLEGIEIICINDGSTDTTGEILEKYADEHSNIVILNQQNQGAGIARNLGIEHANGEFIAFMDSDDYYFVQESLKKLYDAAVRENAMVCGGSMRYLGRGNLHELGFKESGMMMYKEYQCLSGFTRFIYNTKFLRESKIRFPAYRLYEDPLFFAMIMIKADKFYTISDCIYAVRSTDKTRIYSNKGVLMDVLNGICDNLKISKINRFAMMHTDVVLIVANLIGYIYKLIYQGNADVRECYEKVLSEIDGALLGQDVRKISAPVLLSDEEICQIVKHSIKREQELFAKINSYETVLIYGAGVAGHLFYHYMEKRGCGMHIEFMVSAEVPDYTACGKKVHSIREYVHLKDSALVVIVNKNSIEEMKETALNYQFQNIELVRYDEFLLFGADIVEENHLTIY